MGKIVSNVDRIYENLRQMAADFSFKPDERINESELALLLQASRTPVREALNRLVADGFLTFQSGRGFYCRSLDPQRILDLYEARVAIECEALRLTCQRAKKKKIEAVSAYLDAIEPEYATCTDVIKLLEMDEEFHLRLVMLSENAELERMLRNLNDRIRYIRMIDLKRLRSKGPDGNPSLSAHRLVMSAVRKRKAAKADLALREHIQRRREEATEAVQIAYSQLYVPTG
jgi:DNA-binding GntR family transcriptional regulator